MTDTKQLTEMLKHLGWGSGFRLPIANDENKKLEELLDVKQSRLIALSSELQETSLAVENTASYIKNLDSKIKHIKDIEGAKRRQIEKEKQILILSEREQTKTLQDMKKMEKRLKDLTERNEILQSQVLRRKDSLAELVDVINFDKKAIAAYEEKLEKEDAYMNFINEIAETDNEKAKRCQEDYRKIGETIEASRVRLDATVSESEIMDTEFEFLTKRFRKAHEERNQSIENWKRTLVALEARDEEIMHMCYEHDKAAIKVKKTKETLEKQEAFFEQIQHQTKSYLSELNLLERKMSRLHEQKQLAQAELDENSDALSELVSYIVQVEKEIKSVMKQLQKFSEEAEGWYDKMMAMKEDLERLKAKYDVVTMEHLTSAEQTNQLQEFLDKEEQKAEALVRELEKQTNWKSQKERQLVDLNAEGTLYEAKARNLKSGIGNIKKRSKEILDTLMKNRQMEYKLDHQVMSLTTKLRSMENPERDFENAEEYRQMRIQLSKLEATLEDLYKNQRFIKQQVQHCDQVTLVGQRELKKEKEEFKSSEVKLFTLKMQIKRIGKEHETAVDTIKDLVVNQSLSQVQLRRLLHALKDYETKLVDLEQERSTLQTVVKARKKDIETYCTLLVSKKRALQDESQKLRGKIYDVSCEAQARKRKYEMILTQMWTGDQEALPKEEGEGSGRSEAYYIIKLAQEREQYKQEGDKWDQRVKEAEKIVEGLQNTLALMIGTNEVFKDSLKPATANTVEGQQLQELKDKQLEAAHNLKMTKYKRDEYKAKLAVLQGKLDAAIAEKYDMEQQFFEKQYELQSLINEISGQKEKIRRATLQANKLVKELSKLETLDAELLQNDLRLRVTKEKYEFAVATLEKLLSVHPQLLEETMTFLQDKKMMALANRLMQKSSTSLVGSPYTSGRSTPSGPGSRISVRKEKCA